MNMDVNKNQSSISRSLENAIKSSMDVKDLNNLVSSLRIPAKKSKVDAIHRLSSMINKLRKRKGTSDQVKANNNKADRVTEEIMVIKKLNLDKVIKFALGNTYTLDETVSHFKHDIEVKAMVRMALQKPLQKRVEEWRQKHSDWKDLAAYISQHTGRRFKPKDSNAKKDIESKPKFKHQVKSLGPITGQNTTVESTATSDDQEHSDSSHQLSSDSSHQLSSDSDSEQSNCSDTTATANDRLQASSNTEMNDESDVKPDQSDTGAKVTHGGDNISHLNSSKSDKLVKNDQCKDVGAVHQPPINPTLSRGSEMVVAKLNLDGISKEQEDQDDISFLFRGHTAPNIVKESGKPKKKRRSGFFITDDASDSDSEDDKPEGTTAVKSASYEPWDDDGGDVISDARLYDAKRALYQTTFMGSLAGRSKTFKDYAGYRIQNRQKNKEMYKKAPYEKPNKAAFSAARGKKIAVSHDSGSVAQKPAPAASRDEKLHPSWEASKKRKLQQTNLQAFQGKKKTFDD